MSGHLDGPPPGPPDPPYIPGDLGAPSAEEFARRRGQAATFDPRRPHEPEIPPAPDEEAIRCDERERLSARVYENGWCPTCAHKADPDAMPPHEVAAILVDPAEVLSPEEVAEYERCQQSVIDARRRAPMVEGQMIVGAAASPDERLREALELIRAHARLDLTERGIAEAERYAVIADDALTGSDLLASSTAEKLASPRKHSASASDPMPLCDCEFCARPLRDHEEETR